MALVLVIDDHADNRGVIQALLTPFGHRVIEAADGAEGLTLVQAQHPDLVIADILMPTMDGYEFVRRLRAEPPSIAAIPVVFHTAYFHNREASALARECGVEHIITKPCEPEVVLRIVEAVLADGGVAAPPPRIRGTDFETAHLRLVSDRLSQTSDDLSIANQRLLALHEGNLKLASERDPALIVQGFCDTARQLVGAQNGLVVAGYNGHGNGRREPCLIGSGMNNAALAALDGINLERAFARIARGHSGVMHLNAGAASEFVDLLAELPPVCSLLLTTLRSPHHVYGWACLTNKLGGADFSTDDAQVLDTIAQLAGRIYENGSLYAELDRRATELEREVVVRREAEARIARLHRIQALLSSVNGLIVRVRGRQELFDEACHIAVMHGGFSSAWIGLVDADRDAVEWVATAGSDSPDGAPWSTHDTQGAADDSRRDVVARAITTRAAAYDDGAATGKRRHGPGTYRSAIALPLLVDSTVVGVYVLFAIEYGVFNEDETRILNELAGDISFALDYMAKAAQAEYLAYYDAVTGLPNRRLFLEHLAHALRRESPDHDVVVAIGDIKHFRAINESLGLQAGDAVLKEIAQRLQVWVSAPENLARIAGDRFATFLTDIHDPTDVAHRIERLDAESLRMPITVGDSQLRLGFAIGVAVHPQDGADAETLFHNAEAALARAKSTGETYRFYEPSLNARVAETLHLESRLRRALDEHEFVLHYQPKIAIRTGRIAGVEALIRWQDPERGLIPPGQFIPLLEDTGLILDVGNWALIRAADDHAAWKSAGLAPPRVAVNISPAQLRHRDFIDNVMQALDHFDGDVALDLEITESMLMEQFQDAIKRLNIVRGLGVEIALDDFGTGYSSLGYAARLPINTIKIDRSFVIEMLGDPYCRNIVTMIIGLAHTLGLEVVAEGVDDVEQVRVLRELDCDVLQGYLFSRPLPADSLAEFLRLPAARLHTS